MASAPDPSIPLPSFCANLKWETSAAFKIQWVAMTSVRYRHIGHLKNTLNPDEYGAPLAVLVGKDGQEICEEAGRGVVEILDEAEEMEINREMSGMRAY